MKISSDRMLEEIAVLALNYPAAMMGPDEIAALLPIWEADLGHLSERLFLEAVAEYRRSHRFFPCTAEILEAAKAVENRRMPKGKLLTLPLGERPEDYTRTNRVVQLVVNLRRRNPRLGFAEAGRLAREQTRKGGAA